MDPALREFLGDLYEFGRQNDAAKTAPAERMRNITPETGEFLRMLVIAGNLRRVLELGTSNGYSTIWLADGCRSVDGRVVTVEIDTAKHAMALENFRLAGAESWIDARLADISDVLPDLRGFDLVFLDTDRSKYVGWWPYLQESLRSDGLLVVDNASNRADELAPFVRAIEETAGFTTVLAPIGKGEVLVLKER